ncbi:facilitated trehalose transporter Tret1-like [Ochlerotatus camptorhynchus]|uniref:facilitated trehalose transporter Tret1-like n=1 Tax=Ochlerotatus camptorhynchus TaxID=644619 RepID=UPI0031DB5806
MSFSQLLKAHFNEYLAALAVATALFMILLCMSWSSPALPKLLAEDSPIPITPDEGSWIVAIISIGLILGPFVAAKAADRIGRKRTLLFSAVPIMAGWLLMAFGNTVLCLYLARFLFGLSYGTVFSVKPLYFGETFSPNIRGSAVILSGVCGKLAAIVMYGIGPHVAFRTLAWIGMIGPIVFVLSFMWMPESPHFLLSKGKFKEAESSLLWLRRSSNVTKELEVMKVFVQRSNHESGSFLRMFAPVYRKNIRIMCIIYFGLTFTGVFMIKAYAQTIFMKISSDIEPAEMSLILGVIQALATVITFLTIDRVGRRPLLLFSATGTTLGLLVVCVYFATSSENDAPFLGWMAFIALLVVVASFDMGLLVIPPIYGAEVLPRPIRAYTNATSTSVLGLAHFMNLKLFQVLTDYVGTYVPFAGYTVAGLITGVLIYLYVPETKGMSLEDIEQMIAKGQVRAEKRVSDVELRKD